MRGTRVKRIRKDVDQMVKCNPELWGKYPIKRLYRNAKIAWIRWTK
jgi:hypothetical protein